MALHRTSLFHNGVLYPHYHLCHYLPVSIGKDELSRSLLSFKAGVAVELRVWIDRSLGLLPSSLVPPGATIVRALHHDETSADPGQEAPLDLLGTALALHFDGHYLPQLLRKSRPARKIFRLPTGEREKELKDIYYICDQPNSYSGDPGAVLLIDDILTTGTTAGAIIDPLMSRFPDCEITLFTLAKASPAGN